MSSIFGKSIDIFGKSENRNKTNGKTSLFLNLAPTRRRNEISIRMLPSKGPQREA